MFFIKKDFLLYKNFLHNKKYFLLYKYLKRIFNFKSNL